MQNSLTECTNISEFNTKVVEFHGMGVSGIVPAGGSYNLDLKLDDDHFVTGGFFRAKNANSGDRGYAYAVDKDNLLGYGPNVVLAQFIDSYFMRADSEEQFNIVVPYPSKLLAGLYLRIVYVSTGAQDVSIYMNYILHKILV